MVNYLDPSSTTSRRSTIYAPGLFGWVEGGWRMAIALALLSELGAVITLAAGLAGPALRAR